MEVGPMTCPECARKLDADARFCDVCRTPVGYTGATQSLVANKEQAGSGDVLMLYSFDGSEPIMYKRPR